MFCAQNEGLETAVPEQKTGRGRPSIRCFDFAQQLLRMSGGAFLRGVGRDALQQTRAVAI
jgi:hypothetical protein